MIDERLITIGESTFQATWLRDNCLCDQCRHHGSHQKTIDVSAWNSPPSAANADIIDNELVITWNETPAHRSVFPLPWLERHAYHPGPVPEPLASPTLWRATTWEGHEPPWRELTYDAPPGQRWQDDLLTYGFALFQQVTLAALEEFLDGLGPVHHTEYGKFAEIRATPKSCDLSETSGELSPHTDYSTYMTVPPLIQFLFFAKNEAAGGETILVDGFRAAEDLRTSEPELFHLLVSSPVQFQQVYDNWQYHFIRSRPVIELSPDGAVAGVFFGHSHGYPWNLPIGSVEGYYAAYDAFFAQLKDPSNQYLTRIPSGGCVAVQNQRVLHGRKSFAPTTGERHLVDAYLSWDFFEARERYLTDRKSRWI